MKIEDDAVRKALEENAELEVYHLEDAEAEPEQVQEVNLESAAVEFQAESFSIYAVVTPEQHFTHTYQFMDEDGNPIEDIQNQILSANETLTEPKVRQKTMQYLKDGIRHRMVERNLTNSGSKSRN